MPQDEEYRRHERVREDIPIIWKVEQNGRSGEGLIRDISVSGVLMELKTFFSPERNSLMVLSAKDQADDLCIPEKARLVWFRPMKHEMGQFICGLEFVQPSEAVTKRLAQRVESWFLKISQTSDFNILSNYFKGRGRV